MGDIVLARELLARGFNHEELRRLQRQGELRSIRRGAYSRSLAAAATVELQHHELIDATTPLLADGAVVSHVSAAVLHGLPVWTDNLDRVHVTRTRSNGGRLRRLVHVHAAALQSDDVIRVDGRVVTSLARTVIDLARTLPFERAVAAGDGALRRGLTRARLDEALQQAARWPGARQARRVVAFVDGRSESAGESVSRVRIMEDGLPAPEPQREIRDPRGALVARVDFGWEEHRTVGEFDGKVKYGALLKPGQTARDSVYDEKRREDAIRDLGWQVVRWNWADLYRERVISDRLRRAFARNR